MFEKGKIILVPFPFTDLSSQKVRPAVVLSKKETASPDVIVAFVTSKKPHRIKYAIPVSPKQKTSGIKVLSWIRCDKIATLDKKIVLGEIGDLPPTLRPKVKSTLKLLFDL